MIDAVSESTWDRYAAAAGLVAAVALALQIVIAPLYPWWDDPSTRVVEYYSANASAIRVQILLTGLAGVVFLWWLGSLRVYLRRAEGDPGRLSAVAFGSGVAAAAVAAIGAVSTVAAANGSVSAANGGVYRALALRMDVVSVVLHELRLSSYTVSWFALAPMLAAVAVVGARVGAFPRWHMYASYALTVLSLAAGLSVLIDSGPFTPGGPFTIVLYGLFILWLGATSGLMVYTAERRRGPTGGSEPSRDDVSASSPAPLPAAPRDADATGG
jgi:hypothetical protein